MWLEVAPRIWPYCASYTAWYTQKHEVWPQILLLGPTLADIFCSDVDVFHNKFSADCGHAVLRCGNMSHVKTPMSFMIHWGLTSRDVSDLAIWCLSWNGKFCVNAYPPQRLTQFFFSTFWLFLGVYQKAIFFYEMDITYFWPSPKTLQCRWYILVEISNKWAISWLLHCYHFVIPYFVDWISLAVVHFTFF